MRKTYLGKVACPRYGNDGKGKEKKPRWHGFLSFSATFSLLEKSFPPYQRGRVAVGCVPVLAKEREVEIRHAFPPSSTATCHNFPRKKGARDTKLNLSFFLIFLAGCAGKGASSERLLCFLVSLGGIICCTQPAVPQKRKETQSVSTRNPFTAAKRNSKAKM